MTGFDIRNQILGAEKANDYYQAGFDVTNRAVALYGAIPFDQLLPEPWGQIIPRIVENARIAAHSGLIRKIGPVLDLLTRLQDKPNLSFRALLSDDLTPDICEANEILLVLWVEHGVLLPCLPEHDDRRSARLKALDDLTRIAPGYTYRELFEVSKVEAGDSIARAVDAAINNQAAGIMYNDMCCSGGTCVPCRGKSCYPAPGGGCSLASQGC